MKKALHFLLAVLLLAGLTATAQIQRGKTPSAPKTEQTTKKPKQSSSSTSSGKSKKTSKTSTQQSSSAPRLSKQSSVGMSQAQKDRIIQQAVDEMVWVEGGTFTMGATPEQGTEVGDNEKPAHQVALSGYYIGRYEVTQELWQVVMGKTPSHFKNNPKNPVEQVSWEDCQEFITKLNRITGKRFRLPTEAEWEYAASGGNQSRGYKYAGSNNLDAVAWYHDNSGSTTHPVGTKAANELGLYDMSGNVLEWCQDWYAGYSNVAQTNPTGASSGSDRVGRGGSWGGLARSCRVSYRSHTTPSDQYFNYGLRLAL